MTSSDDDLATRLDRLALETDTCTLGEFQQIAAELRQDAGLQQALIQAEALANENRLLSLALLRRRGSLCACEIQAALGCTNATVSHHMGQLEDAGLVATEKQGKWKHYELTGEGRRLVGEVIA